MEKRRRVIDTHEEKKARDRWSRWGTHRPAAGVG